MEVGVDFCAVGVGTIDDEVFRGVKGSGTDAGAEIVRVLTAGLLICGTDGDRADGAVRWGETEVVSGVEREVAAGVLPHVVGGAGGIPDTTGAANTCAPGGAVGASAGGLLPRPQWKMRVANERAPPGLVAGCPASMIVITSPLCTTWTS
jgi:hypothetical protein